MKLAILSGIVLCQLLMSCPVSAEEHATRPLWKFRRDAVASITQMQNNIVQMDKSLGEIQKLLKTARLRPEDRATLVGKQKELTELKIKQRDELLKARHYLKDFDTNRSSMEKMQLEIKAIDKRRSNLEKVYKVGKFRIFYSLKGRDSLPNARRSDVDRNGIPDYIQNVALQLVHADQFFVQVMGLKHPFKQPPFIEDNIRYVDINIVRSPLDPKQSKIKGKAWNRPRELPRRYFSGKPEKTLMIDISNDFDLTYGVPAHELFHLFQYGYTQFSSAWFSEGTATWAQNHFGGVTPRSWKVPKNKQQLFNQKYDSVKFWDEICERVDQHGVAVPAALTKHRYVGRNFNIIPKRVAHCMLFMRSLLTQLARIEARVTRERNILPYNWPQGVRDDPANEAYIWEALRSVVE